MPSEICRGIERPRSLVINDDEQTIFRLPREHFLHQRLIQDSRAVEMHGLIFLSRPDIEKLNSIRLEQVFELLRRNHHAFVVLRSRAYLLEHLLGIETTIAAADLSKSLFGLEPTTGAPADMIIPKKSTLGTRIGFQQFSHGHVPCRSHLVESTACASDFNYGLAVTL